MLYNLSEFITLLKEDAEISDIPLPVDDNAIAERFRQSALKEFSVRCPRIDEVMLTSKNIISDANLAINGSVTYQIPKEYYQDSMILEVLGIDAGDRSGAGASLYMPSLFAGGADNLLMSIADIKMAASMGSMMTHAPTYRFFQPDKLVVYNGWTGYSFLVELSLLHDINLTTVPPTAMTHLRQLAVLDLKAFLYSKLKRKDNLDLGIGNTSLKIESWESAASEMRDLLKTWDDEGANLDRDTINYY